MTGVQTCALPILGQLAALYCDWGRFEDADYFGEKSLSIFRKQGAPAAGRISGLLALLATIQWGLGNGIVERDLLRESLQLEQKDLNTDPQVLIRTLHSLARACLLIKGNNESQSLLQKAMDIADEKFPPDSVQRADCLEDMADLFISQGKTDQARPLYEKALPIYQRFVGVYFGYSSLDYLKKLAKAYESVGKFKEAQNLFEKALPTLKENFGDSHPRVVVGLLDLAAADKALGQTKEAKECAKEALDILKKVFPAGHPLVKEAKNLSDKI